MKEYVIKEGTKVNIYVNEHVIESVEAAEDVRIYANCLMFMKGLVTITLNEPVKYDKNGDCNVHTILMGQ